VEPSGDGHVPKSPRKQKAEDTAKLESEFGEFWAAYKRKDGKTPAFKRWLALRGKGASHAALLAAARNYSLECQMDGKETRYIKLCGTFLGRDEHWRDYVSRPDLEAEVRQREELERYERQRQLRFEKLSSQGFPGDPYNTSGKEIAIWAKHMAEKGVNVDVSGIGDC
jgi:hypothetical protein